MSVLHAVLLVMLAAVGTAVVLIREPLRQVIVAGLYGTLLPVVFFALQAPDVALSAIAVGAVAAPLMILLALSKIREGEE